MTISGGSEMTVSVEDVEKSLRLTIENLKKSDKAKEEIATWIDKYDGKIIEFHVNEKKFHIVFTKKATTLEKGTYPSPDLTIVAQPDVLMGILSGKIRLSSSLLGEGKLSVRGSFHEAKSFVKVLLLGG